MNNSFNIPKSVGLIMDGNGRWMKKQGRSRLEGHTYGIRNMTRLISHMLDLGVKNIVCYGLSTENLQRPKEEIDHIYQLIIEMYEPFIKMMEEKQSQVKYVGDLNALPSFVLESIKQVELKLSVFASTGKCVYIGIAYGGRNEIIQSINMHKNEECFTEEMFLSKLSVPINLDLIIRTGGEYRLSNFMLYQAAYAELFFSEKLFPEFTEDDLDDALVWYNSRKRRFGLLEN